MVRQWRLDEFRRADYVRWPLTEAWLADAATAIALSVNNAACLLDMESVILDGSFSRELLAALQTALNRALDRYRWEGVTRPAVLPGTIGPDARALGGALLPLHANFSPDRALLFENGGGVRVGVVTEEGWAAGKGQRVGSRRGSEVET